MPEDHLNPPVFEISKFSQDVSLAKTPYFYNDNGNPAYLAELPEGVTPLVPAATNPLIAIGREYVVSEVIGVKQTPPYGVETQLGFVAGKAAYEPLWATRDVAAAFGITLVEKGQGVRLSSPVERLSQVEYEYGVFAGHWSPYQNTGNRLLSVVCTDLEHHDFPHVFASTDPRFPLVISVGRYWPKLNKIRLADLWVPQGAALYIPPKPALPDQECVDLHNNRNSARACWGDIVHDAILTHTLLQTSGGFFYWYWNARDTAHSRPF
ncbi:MAG: hypothetical protein KGJ97_00860 [Xanthomonadaceae bacterium]|jgi:hypothetical protein|nr:hypothetical protein [Xanthomonadaceae bacterium]MDE3073062.1 hypothetical protein [Pseudomonadota bacterium]